LRGYLFLYPLRLIRTSALSISTPFPYTTLFRSHGHQYADGQHHRPRLVPHGGCGRYVCAVRGEHGYLYGHEPNREHHGHSQIRQDRKSTRLNSSHVSISYAVFCLKKKKRNNISS